MKIIQNKSYLHIIPIFAKHRQEARAAAMINAMRKSEYRQQCIDDIKYLRSEHGMSPYNALEEAYYRWVTPLPKCFYQ